MWFKLKSYLIFLLKSNNQHGVHSPFIYILVTECFYKKTNSSKKAFFIKIKKWLISNRKTILVTDFGKGSKVFKSKKRKACDITKAAGISTKKALLLIRFIQYFNLSNILEIGTSDGLGTSTMAISNKNATITTLERCKQISAIAKELFTKFQLNNIEVIVGTFKKTLPLTLKNHPTNLIYFDGNHQKTATLEYFNICIQKITNESIFIFDDIYRSKEMLETWEIIKNHPKVTVTINTYHLGFVFFRKEQTKQHFTIRV